MFLALTVNGVQKLYLNEARNDLWIREIVFPNRRRGYFVEAGAADGITGSSCFLLEMQYQWRGICIEPHDQSFAQLARTRPNSIHANVCLASENGWVDFAVASGGMNPLLSGVRRALDHKWQGDRVLANATITAKKCAPLADLLRQHHAPSQIEYGAFDIEGSEYEALRSFPFEQYRFLALSFELDRGTRGPVSGLLASHGYRETVNPFNQDCPWERYWLHRSIADGHPLRD